MVEVALKGLPPVEALAYLRSKGLAPPEGRFDYRDTWREQHAASFVVAKGMNDDILTLLRDSIITAKSDGTPMEAWRETVALQLQDAGWWGRQDMLDPLTGEIENVQLGSMRRLRVIFDTNSRVADAAGRWASIQRTKNVFPYLGYRQIDRPTKRPAHTRFNGLVRPVDDPVWERIYPPNGYFCMCSVFRITQGQIDRGEYVLSPSFDLDELAIPNDRRGDDDIVPNGVTPGFDYNPGMVWLDMQTRMEGLEGHPNLPELLGAGTQLRLNAVRENMERGVFITPAGTLRHPVWGSQKDGMAVTIPSKGEIEPGWDFIHSHPFEGTISPSDVFAMFDHQMASLTAVTPEGSVFSIAPGENQFDRMHRQRLLLAYKAFKPRLTDRATGNLILNEGFLRYLEREGVIAYYANATGAYRDQLTAAEPLLSDFLDIDAWLHSPS